MRRGLIALATGLSLGLGAAAPALATPTLAATGDATSITASSADLNGAIYRERVGARWLFEYSTDASFDGAVATTIPRLTDGRLNAVETKVSGLTPATTYFWRVVLTVREGTAMAQTFGATHQLTTLAAAVPARRSGARRSALAR